MQKTFSAPLTFKEYHSLQMYLQLSSIRDKRLFSLVRCNNPKAKQALHASFYTTQRFYRSTPSCLLPIDPALFASHHPCLPFSFNSNSPLPSLHIFTVQACAALVGTRTSTPRFLSLDINTVRSAKVRSFLERNSCKSLRCSKVKFNLYTHVFLIPPTSFHQCSSSPLSLFAYLLLPWPLLCNSYFLVLSLVPF